MNAPVNGVDFVVAHESIKATILTSLMSVWVLIGVFVYLNRYTKRRYFTLWTTAWMFYVIWLTLNLNDLALERGALQVMAKQWCLIAAAVFLMWGSFRFLKVRVRESVIGAFMAVLFLWSYIGVYHLRRPLAANVSLYALIGLAGISAGIAFARHRCLRGYIGASMLALGFCLWGLYFIAFPFAEKYPDLLATAFFISAVLQLFIAVAMIILVLEEVRSTNQNTISLLRSEKLKASQLQEAVSSREKQFRNLFDKSGEAIVIASAEDLRILDVNERGARFLGLSRGEADPQFLSSFCPVEAKPPASSNDTTTWVHRVSNQRRLSVVKKNGDATLSEVESSPVEFEGRPAYQFLFREVTDRSKLEEQLRQAEKLSSIGQMVSGVAHELNNPLSVIKGYLELVIAHHPISNHTRSDLEKVIQESNRAIKLVRDFLSFSRSRPARREKVDVNTFIRRVVELRRSDFSAAGVELFLNLGGALPTIPADADQVQQLVINLLNNSLQAMTGTPSPRTLRITTIMVSPETLRLSIEDSGPGVPPGLESKIFEPFFTTKPAGIGTGLGLSIAHTIMREHRGRIYYQRSSLGGAGFHLEFPAASKLEELPELEPLPVEEPPPRVSRGEKCATVLVLDDEKFIAELLGEMLQVLGHKAVLCSSGAQALEKAVAGDFDLVISDFRMPEMNGEQFYRELQRLKPSLAVRTVFLTGDVVNKQTQEFLASTGNPHLDKPFQITRLEAVINSVLAGETAAVVA